MKTILQIPKKTYSRLEWLASERRLTVDAYLIEVIEEIIVAPKGERLLTTPEPEILKALGPHLVWAASEPVSLFNQFLPIRYTLFKKDYGALLTFEQFKERLVKSRKAL